MTKKQKASCGGNNKESAHFCGEIHAPHQSFRYMVSAGRSRNPPSELALALKWLLNAMASREVLVCKMPRGSQRIIFRQFYGKKPDGKAQ
jgi:hypothetical protein